MWRHENTDFLMLDKIPILAKETGIAVYDFRFRDYFPCHSIMDAVDQPVLLRVGGISDYSDIASMLNERGFRLLLSEQEHDRASLLENWYPLLEKLTPYSVTYEQFPPLEIVLQDFSFPVFIKGNRQTNHHKKSQCIINNPDMFRRLASEWQKEKYLHWQKIAVREYVPLRIVDDVSFPNMLPFSYEFRVFFWKQQMVGCGKYWCLGQDYILLEEDKEQALGVAQKAACILNVPFLAVDIAKTQQEEWIVVEVNDGQESGYAGVNALSLWSNIIIAEQGKDTV